MNGGLFRSLRGPSLDSLTGLLTTYGDFLLS